MGDGADALTESGLDGLIAHENSTCEQGGGACPYCNSPLEEQCHIRGCSNPVEYSGWVNVPAPLTGERTGKNQKIRVCRNCRKYLNGA